MSIENQFHGGPLPCGSAIHAPPVSIIVTIGRDRSRRIFQSSQLRGHLAELRHAERDGYIKPASRIIICKSSQAAFFADGFLSK